MRKRQYKVLKDKANLKGKDMNYVKTILQIKFQKNAAQELENLANSDNESEKEHE